MFWGGVDVGSTYTKITGINSKQEIVYNTVIPTIVNQDEIVKKSIYMINQLRC